MKIFFRLFVICFLAFAVVSCNQNSDTNPITKPDPDPNPDPDPKPDPNPDPKPDPDPNPDPDPEPDPETNGLDEIIATRQPGGMVEGKLSYSVEWNEKLEFSYANQEVSYFMTGLKLSTPKGNSLKAIALIWHEDKDTIPSNAKGELEFKGIITELQAFKTIRATANLKISLNGTLVDAQAALLLVDATTTLAEDNTRFVADDKFNASLGTPSKAGVFPYTAEGDDGEVLVGFGLDDGTLNFGELDPWNISYFAEGKKTAYGTVKQLTGFLNPEKGYGITALAINLKQPKPVEKVVVVCDGCKEDVVLGLPDGWIVTDDLWLTTLAFRPGIPGWITGQSSIPLEKDPTCDDLYKLHHETVHAANLYRSFSLALKYGAKLVQVSEISQIEHIIGSKAHKERQQYFYNAMNLSFTRTQTLLEMLDNQGCFK